MQRTLFLLGLSLLPTLAVAQPAPPVASTPEAMVPAEARGRYSFQPVDGGVLKMDSQTGMVSLCSRGAGGSFSCLAVPDSRDAYEAEIARLQAQLAGKGPAATVDSGNKLTVPLPSQNDLDAAYAYAAGLYNRMKNYIQGTEP
ncbi:hypothetical protein GCM10007301_53960 [Azorhizobium oxalatiphilum]|uniref:Uncharacterized protein n=1 Tax=Azorhizobium oxalatiphilum TaxID=980631 RepID=A0A917CGX4_9HYPH|nr:hypothetical protein [Azorhizobium oxalatiphilum]GGF87258.1 hypothetical protein GCM10007301_53960 [Azorhizobium oxalatiphilum]